MFNPKRLSLARKRRRLTSRGLAREIGVSPVTITRLERGKNEPDPKTVDALSIALNFPKEFFFDSDFDELNGEGASFRSLSAITAKERDAALSSGELAFMLSDWVSEMFVLPEADLIDLSHERDPAAAARTLRQVWGLGEKPISNMIKLLESKGIKVFSLSENTKNVDAFSCWRNETPYVFLNTFKSSERCRFDAAHELGHLVLHKHGGPNQGREAETQANHFAGSFLMPRADIVARIPFVPTIRQLIKLKKRWGVSVAALAFRLHRVGILSDWHYRTLYIQIAKLGYRKKEPEEMPREESVVWEQVFSQLWNEKITKESIARSLHLPLGEIENLVFGLINLPEPPRPSKDSKTPVLRIITAQ